MRVLTSNNKFRYLESKITFALYLFIIDPSIDGITNDKLENVALRLTVGTVTYDSIELMWNVSGRTDIEFFFFVLYKNI